MPRTNAGKIDTLTAAKAAEIELLPAWQKRNVTEKQMNKRRKRTSEEVCRDQFQDNSLTKFRQARYKVAYKGATKEYHDIINSVVISS